MGEGVVVAGVGAVIGGFVSAAVVEVVATVIVYAAVGAVIGGLMAAVTGGDIGKGVLFGAIGGAVTGGITSWAGGAAGGAAGVGYEMGGTAGASGTGVFAAGGSGAKAITAMGASSAAGSGSSGGMMQGMGSALVTTGGSMIAKGFDDTAEKAAEQAALTRASNEKQYLADHENRIKLAEMQAGAADVSSGRSLEGTIYSANSNLKNAREQREQDYKMKQDEYNLIEEARKRRAGSVSSINAPAVQGPGIINPAGTIDKQVYVQPYENPLLANKPSGVLQGVA